MNDDDGRQFRCEFQEIVTRMSRSVHAEAVCP